MRIVEVGEAVSALAFRRDGAILATASRDGVRLWCPQTGALRLWVSCAAHLSPWQPLTFAPGGRLAFARVYLDPSGVPLDGRKAFFNELRVTALLFNSYYCAMAYDRDHRHCVGLTPFSLEVKSVSRRRSLLTLANRGRWPRRFPGSCESLSLTGDAQRVAAAFLTEEVVVFDLARKRVACRLPHPGVVGRVLFSPDGSVLATATPSARVVRLWRLGRPPEATVLPTFRKKPQALAFSPDGRLLAVGCADGTVRLWDVPQGREAARYDWGVGAVSALAFAPDGQTAAAGAEKSVVIWDIDV